MYQSNYLNYFVNKSWKWVKYSKRNLKGYKEKLFTWFLKIYKCFNNMLTSYFFQYNYFIRIDSFVNKQNIWTAIQIFIMPFHWCITILFSRTSLGCLDTWYNFKEDWEKIVFHSSSRRSIRIITKWWVFRKMFMHVINVMVMCDRLNEALKLF